jgi:hypothetical protein
MCGAPACSPAASVPRAKARRCCGRSSNPAASTAPAAISSSRGNLDRPGKFRETFSAISYTGQEGAPSWASSLDLPTPGCWRLRLSSGELRAFVDIRAVRLAP